MAAATSVTRVAMLVPAVWEGNRELADDVRDFYRYHAGLVEPWDGPAGLVFTDGACVGATLDRNGLRPLRVAICDDGLVVVLVGGRGRRLSDGHGASRRGKLGPGPDARRRSRRAALEDERVLKRRLARRRPYGQWLDEGLVNEAPPASRSSRPATISSRDRSLFGYTREELAVILRPMATHAHEPTSSMGDDTALAPLAGRARVRSSATSSSASRR